jgi:hypothetical protein
LTRKKLICFIAVVALTLKTSPQSPLSNLFIKITPKLIHMYDPTLRHEEKVVTKVEPTIKVIVKYFKTFIKS